MCIVFSFDGLLIKRNLSSNILVDKCSNSFRADTLLLMHAIISLQFSYGMCILFPGDDLLVGDVYGIVRIDTLF